MNPIEYAISVIHREIPPQLLQQAFPSFGTSFDNTVHSLDARIKSNVIDRWVMTDIKLVGGTETYAPVEDSVTEQVDMSTFVYRIDERWTQGREITQVLTIGQGTALGYGMLTNGTYGYGSPNAQMQQQAVNAAAPGPILATSHLQLIGPNTFLAKFAGYQQYSFGRGIPVWAQIRIADDAYFSSIVPSAFQDFAELCVLAVKSYVYNQLVVSVDEAMISSGQQLGVFRERLWEYSDSNTLYKEAVRKWTKIAHMIDAPRHHSFIRQQFLSR